MLQHKYLDIQDRNLIQTRVDPLNSKAQTAIVFWYNYYGIIPLSNTYCQGYHLRQCLNDLP